MPNNFVIIRHDDLVYTPSTLYFLKLKPRKMMGKIEFRPESDRTTRTRVTDYFVEYISRCGMHLLAPRDLLRVTKGEYHFGRRYLRPQTDLEVPLETTYAGCKVHIQVFRNFDNSQNFSRYLDLKLCTCRLNFHQNSRKHNKSGVF